MKKIFLYTPWCEQGLSYDAKAIEKIAIENNLDIYITFDKKRKIKWPCNFIKTKILQNEMSENDILFCFERIPQKYLNTISEITKNLYLMINYEYYDRDLLKYYNLFKTIFCKSQYAYEECKKDKLDFVKYMPWILWEFPVTNVKQLDEKIKIIFNGGTGGYKDRRNLESVINLFKDYVDDNVELTIKLTKDLRRWTKRILSRNKSFINNDNRINLIQATYNRQEYIEFLKQFDINLCPSKYEGFGLTLLEGLHSRLASITINQSPMNEIILNDENGFCVKNIPIDKIRNQQIYDVDRKHFYKKFNDLVNNEKLIMLMKQNTIKIIDKNEDRFKKYFNKIIK